MASHHTSIRLKEETVELCKYLTGAHQQHFDKNQEDKINYSGSIYDLTLQFNLLIKENAPSLTHEEKLTFAAAYNGHIPFPDINEEIRTLHLLLADYIEYGSDFDSIMPLSQMQDLLKKTKEMTIPERLSVIFMIKRFWKKGDFEL